MTNEQSPITPPRHLVERWRAAASNIPASSCSDPGGRRDYINYIATQAARWSWDQRGAATEAELRQAKDEELEACEQWVEANFGQIPTYNLHQFRRPKPPSLKEQAFAAFKNSPVDSDSEMLQLSADAELIIRRALEALPND